MVGLLFALAWAIRLPTLDQPLVEAHAFRQTQTAYTARLFHEEGVDLLHPRLPVLDERGEVPFEFPLFQAIAAGVMSAGLSPDTAMRTTSLFFFLVSGLLLYGLVRDLVGRRAALASAAIFLFSPFSMVWSRAALIEYLAVAGSLGFFWAGLRWRRFHQWPYAGAAVGAGLVAMLVKPTTGVFWIIPLLLHEGGTRAGGWREWLARRRDPVLAVIVVIPVVAAALWTRHADAIKAAGPATRWLTSSALEAWNFGTAEQRADLGSWGTVGGRVQRLFAGIPLWLLAVVVALPLRRARLRPVLVGIAGSALGTVAVFFNLYVVHDYYLSAITAQLAILMGIAAVAVFDLASPQRRRGVALLLVIWLVAVFYNERGYWQPTFKDVSDPGKLLPLAREVGAVTEERDRILFEALDWSPVVPYYSHRQGTMIPYKQWTPPVLSTISPDDHDTVVTGFYSGNTAFLMARWEWVTPRGPHVFGVSRTLPIDAPVLAGQPATAGWPTGRGTRELLPAPVPLRCNEMPIEIPVGAGATWLRTDGYPDQRIVVLGVGSVPANRVIIVRPGVVSPGRKLQVSCLGPGSLQVMAAVDAPPP